MLTSILDGLLIVNVLFAAAIFISTIVFRSAWIRKIPSLILPGLVCTLLVNFSSSMLILKYGETYNGLVIKIVIDAILNPSGPESFVVLGYVYFSLMYFLYFGISWAVTLLSESAAKSCLDSLPGKQMAIESDFQNQIISESEFKLRRKRLNEDADLFGSLDGLSQIIRKFIFHGFIITVLSVVGGLILGLSFFNGEIHLTNETYVVLLFGNGLISQIPNLFWALTCSSIKSRG